MASRFFIPTTRIEAFSDGVFAIVMTLLAFQFRVPHFTSDATLGRNLHELSKIYSNFISFVFSFLFVAVFWVTHHQLFHAIKEADRKLLWYNIHLLFWITMLPFPTAMVGDFPEVPLAAISLAFVLLMVSVASYMVRRYSFFKAAQTKERFSAKIIGGGLTKNIIAIILNIGAILVAFISVNISYIIFLIVLALFTIPHKTELNIESSQKQ